MDERLRWLVTYHDGLHARTQVTHSSTNPAVYGRDSGVELATCWSQVWCRSPNHYTAKPLCMSGFGVKCQNRSKYRICKSFLLVCGLCCQRKQFQTSPATTRGTGYQEVRTVEKIARQHTIANFYAMLQSSKYQNCIHVSTPEWLLILWTQMEWVALNARLSTMQYKICTVIINDGSK